jgi:AcrR family transcriptional regulator
MTDDKTTSGATPVSVPGVREQIIDAADRHFTHYGYAKTTVADLARSIGFSKAYIYKFFDSKQDIGEAICSRCLTKQVVAITAAVHAASGAHERFRALFHTAVEENVSRFFFERRLHDIVTHSSSGNWSSSRVFSGQMDELLAGVVREGREAGEFERKTPADEVNRAIWLAMSPFVNPVLLQHSLDEVDQGLPAVINLVLRSLAP